MRRAVFALVTTTIVTATVLTTGPGEATNQVSIAGIPFTQIDSGVGLSLDASFSVDGAPDPTPQCGPGETATPASAVVTLDALSQAKVNWYEIDLCRDALDNWRVVSEAGIPVVQTGVAVAGCADPFFVKAKSAADVIAVTTQCNGFADDRMVLGAFDTSSEAWQVGPALLPSDFLAGSTKLVNLQAVGLGGTSAGFSVAVTARLDLTDYLAVASCTASDDCSPFASAAFGSGQLAGFVGGTDYQFLAPPEDPQVVLSAITAGGADALLLATRSQIAPTQYDIEALILPGDDVPGGIPGETVASVESFDVDDETGITSAIILTNLGNQFIVLVIGPGNFLPVFGGKTGDPAADSLSTVDTYDYLAYDHPFVVTGQVTAEGDRIQAIHDLDAADPSWVAFVREGVDMLGTDSLNVRGVNRLSGWNGAAAGVGGTAFSIASIFSDQGETLLGITSLSQVDVLRGGATSLVAARTLPDETEINEYRTRDFAVMPLATTDEQDIQALAFDPSANLLAGGGTTTPGGVFDILGALLLIEDAKLDQLVSLFFTSDDELVAITRQGDLYDIDLDMQTVVLRSTITTATGALGNVGGSHYVPGDDSVYFTNLQDVYRLDDLDTGAAEKVGTYPGTNLEGMSLDVDTGRFYGSTGGLIIAGWAPYLGGGGSGARPVVEAPVIPWTVVGVTGSDPITALAPVPAPEPGAGWLGVFALATVARLARASTRRRNHG